MPTTINDLPETVLFGVLSDVSETQTLLVNKSFYKVSSDTPLYKARKVERFLQKIIQAVETNLAYQVQQLLKHAAKDPLLTACLTPAVKGSLLLKAVQPPDTF